jgi:light-regulated signal transduction histidine kinase (bacteriophytochrome)
MSEPATILPTLAFSAFRLNDCAKEPIHVPGASQPHGVLLAIEWPSLRIVQMSDNADDVFHRSREDILGQSVTQLVPEHRLDEFKRKLDIIELNHGPAQIFSAELGQPAQRFDWIAHRQNGLLILELERSPEETLDLESFPSRVAGFISRIEVPRPLIEICHLTAAEVRALTGFDRVLIYRFDNDWNGVVIAEERNDVLPSYLDLRFPADDIPAQARLLYQVNRSRQIPNATYRPVTLVPPMNPVTQKPLDLTHAALRSVSPVHLEYMRNMGTAASMSFSIVRDGKLWGLISCHHHAPRAVSYNVRRACELITQVFSLQLAASEKRDEAEYRLRLTDVRFRLLRSMTAHDDYADGLIADAETLLSSASATGAAVVIENTVRTAGVTPAADEILRLAGWLAAHRRQDVFATDRLSAEYPPAHAFCTTASGLLAVAVSAIHDSYLMWFRPEVVQTVTWAGEPTKIESPPEDGPQRLHPRKSFEAWKQTVRGQSMSWRDAEIGTATDLRNDIVGIVLRRAEELAAVNAELERTNKELEAFSYSVSHDLRAPFRHIVGYSELVQELEADRLSDRGKRYISTVIDSARQAGVLIDNLLSFSQMGRNAIHLTTIDMDMLVKEIRDSLLSDAEGRNIEWRLQPLPRAFADLSMLRLAVGNLVDNAIKYTRGRERAIVEISGHETPTECVYSFRDNGVGFDMAYVDKLFGVFQRLHRIEDFEGTGIGLANVRRIISRHGGRTWAVGKPNDGAEFSFSLPKRAPSDGENS